MEQQQNRPRKKVTRRQLRNRRIGGLIVLLLIIFLFAKGCAGCIKCACGTDDDKEKAAQTTTATTEATVLTTTADSLLPQEYLVGELPDSHQITIPVIYQKPELPTGGEVTALAMVLNHLGYDVTKDTLAQYYLTCAERGEATFSQAFIGSPFKEDGLGCFAPVIADTARKYLSSQASSRSVKMLSADNFEDVLLRVASNHPVIVWVNYDLELRQEEYCFTVYGQGLVTTAATTAPAMDASEDGASETVATTAPAITSSSKQDVYWIPNATAVVLTGYDLDNETVTVVDPLQGEITYDMGMFKTSYNALSKQAIIIY